MGSKGKFTEKKRRHDYASQDSDDSIIKRPRNSTGKTRRNGKKHKNFEDADSSASDSEFEKLASRRKGKKKVCENDSSDSEESLAANRGHKKKGKHAILEISSSDESSSSDDLLKLRRCNTSEDVEGVKKSLCYYRSNLKTAVKELGSLVFRESHITAIKKTPFWFLFYALLALNNQKNGSMCRKYEEDIRSIIKTFDKSRRGFLLGGELVKLNKQDVQLIFGVCDGHLPIEKKTEYEIPPWLKRHYGEELNNRSNRKSFSMEKATIFQKLKRIIPNEDETSVKDVARLTHCYLLAGVLAPNRSPNMKWELTRYLENLDDVCLYDWSSMIIDMLLRQITESKNLKSGGCTMLLPYLLCERLGILGPVKRDAFPRFMKWDLTKLHQKMMRICLTKPNSRIELKLKLKPTTYEKRTFRELIEWQDKEGSKQRTNEDDKENRSKSLSQESGTPLSEPNLVDGVATNELFTHAEELIETINSLLDIGKVDVDIPSTSREIGVVPGDELVSETPAEQQNDDVPIANQWDGVPPFTLEVTHIKTEKSSGLKPDKNVDRTETLPDLGAVDGNLDDVVKAVNEENAKLKKELTICKTLVTEKQAEINKLYSEIAQVVKQRTMEKDKYADDVAKLSVDKEKLEMKCKNLESEYKKMILRLSEFANLEGAKLSCIVDLPKSKQKTVEHKSSVITNHGLI